MPKSYRVAKFKFEFHVVLEDNFAFAVVVA